MKSASSRKTDSIRRKAFLPDKGWEEVWSAKREQHPVGGTLQTSAGGETLHLLIAKSMEKGQKWSLRGSAIMETVGLSESPYLNKDRDFIEGKLSVLKGALGRTILLKGGSSKSCLPLVVAIRPVLV